MGTNYKGEKTMFIIRLILFPLYAPFAILMGICLGGDNGGTEKFSWKRAIRTCKQSLSQWWED